MKRLSRSNRAILFALVLLVSFLYSFSFETQFGVTGYYITQQENHSCLPAKITRDTVKKTTPPQLLHQNDPAKTGIVEKLTNLNETGSFSSAFLGFVFFLFYSPTLLTLVLYYRGKSNTTPRYHVISYLHRSDGKKSSR